jgi:hypothetical protein
VVLERQEPEQLLLTALDDVNQVLSAVKSQMRNNAVDPILLEVLGDWMDRLGRLAKTVIDGDVAEKLERRVGWIAADRAAACWAQLSAIVQASPLTAQQKLMLWQSRFDGLRLIADGRAPERLSGDELHRFADSLIETAAVERALADGVMPWDNDGSASEAEAPESFDAGGELVLFPSNGDGSVA